jgi:phosphatidylglycerophosphatase A
MRFKELLFTGFFSGYVPFAPGTAGSLVGMILYMLEYSLLGPIHWAVNLAAVAALFYPSALICGAGEEFFDVKDPGPVVWDEIIGYFVTMLFLPYDWKIAAAGFVLFRIMDIFKPFPAYQLQSLPGGLGILIDDVVAGIYACAALHLILYLLRLCGVSVV